MADSVREKIVSNIATVVGNITVVSGYAFDIKQVFRVPQNPFEMTDYPFSLVVDSTESKTDGDPAQFTQCKLRVEIITWMHHTENFAKEVLIGMAEIEKSLYLDQTRGGFAIDTTAVDNELYISEMAMPLGGFRIGVEILYRHRIGDPYTK